MVQVTASSINKKLSARRGEKNRLKTKPPILEEVISKKQFREALTMVETIA